MQSSNQIISCLDGIINRLGDGTRRKRAYTETKEADDDLYRLLYPCLVERKNNAAAFVMGSRGSGKSRLVDNCLTRMDQSKFHTVRLNGLMIRGNDVGVAVNELVRQLSEIAALQDGRSETTDLVRLKRTNFKSNLALLDEMFHLAKVHHHPILIILDEMDLFVRSCPQLVVASDTVDRSPDRQLLLYHILDRVSTPGSLVCFIGITSHLAAITLLEKRVRSRAEGTSKIFFLNPIVSQSALIELLLTKLDGTAQFRSEVEDWLNSTKETSDSSVTLLRQLFERNYNVGKDFRWYTRVFSIAFSLYREDLRVSLHEDDTHHAIPKTFSPNYLLEAFTIMGASTTNCDNESILTESRTHVLTDLSEPQVSLLLAARRILARDSIIPEPKPLTLERMLNEYQSFKKGNSNRYSRRLLFRCFTQMMEMDIFRPSSDHSGGGPLQYEYGGSFAEMDSTTLTKLPLHVPYGLDSELTRALKDKLFDCSIALEEWGKRIN